MFTKVITLSVRDTIYTKKILSFHNHQVLHPTQILQNTENTWEPRQQEVSQNTPPYEISHIKIFVFLSPSLLILSCPNSHHGIAPIRDVSSYRQNINFHFGNLYWLDGLGFVI